MLLIRFRIKRGEMVLGCWWEKSERLFFVLHLSFFSYLLHRCFRCPSGCLSSEDVYGMCMHLATCCYGFSFSVFFSVSLRRGIRIYTWVDTASEMLIQLRERTDANLFLTGSVGLGR